MRSPVPREPMGLVRPLAGQAVATEFIAIPLPLWPLRGVFVTGGLPGVPPVLTLRGIPLVSVVVAYVRWWCGAVGAFWAMASLLVGWPGGGGAVALLIAGLLAGWLGRERPETQARREILGLAVGVNALPAWLVAPDAQRLFAVLRGDWSMTYAEAHPVAWQDAAARARDVDVVLLPLLYALAAYHARLEGTAEAAALREAVWSQVEARWEPRFLGDAAPRP